MPPEMDPRVLELLNDVQERINELGDGFTGCLILGQTVHPSAPPSLLLIAKCNTQILALMAATLYRVAYSHVGPAGMLMAKMIAEASPSPEYSSGDPETLGDMIANLRSTLGMDTRSHENPVPGGVNLEDSGLTEQMLRIISEIGQPPKEGETGG